MKRLLVLLALLAACSKDSTGVRPPPDFHLSDPEILFHFFYHRDSAGAPLHTEPYPDTAIMRWYKGTPAHPETAELLAQVGITGTDTVCAFFLVADSTPLFFDLGWKRHGVITMGVATVGPFDPTNPDNYDHYWDISLSEDTLAGSASANIESSRSVSYCRAGITRDSIAAGAP